MKGKIDETINFIRSKSDFEPEVLMILGSGLGELAEELDEIVAEFDYKDIPNFPVPTVVGHKGKLKWGYLNGKKVAVLQGRFHYYEGHSMETIIFPILVHKFLNVKSMIVTNAAGGVNKDFNVGDLMILTDHINFMGVNPLRGIKVEGAFEQFADMTYAYDREYIQKAEETANQMNLNIRKGVYLACSGPTYETPAEIRMFRTLGADAVGMSTVPEVIIANQVNLRVLGISCITNMAAGILDQPLSHAEVIETTKKVKQSFKSLIKNTLKVI